MIKSVDKRLKELEKVTPDKKVLNGLGEYYAWENSPEGRIALDKFYYPERYESEK